MIISEKNGQKMNKVGKNVLRFFGGLLIIGYAIYQFGDVLHWWKKPVDYSKLSYVKGLIYHSTTLSTLDSATAFTIADSFYEKFVRKYGKDKLIEIDNRYDKGDTAVYSQFAKPIMDSCIQPFKQKVGDAEYLYNCSHSAMKKGKYTVSQAKSYCSCMIEKLKTKYGDNYSDSATSDSTLKKTILQSGCLDELIK